MSDPLTKVHSPADATPPPWGEAQPHADSRPVPPSDKKGAGNHGGFGNVARAALLWSYLRSFVYGLVAIPTAMILARLLSPSDFGVAAAATFFGKVAALLSSGGMGVALMRVKSLREEHTSTVFLFNLGLSLAAFLALALSASAIGAFFDSLDVTRAMPFVALNFLLAGVFTVPRALLTREMRYREISTAATIDLFVASGLACILAWRGFGYWSLIVGEIAGAFASGVISSYYVGWQPRFRFSSEAFRELFSFGLGSYAKRVIDYAALNADNLVVGRFLGLAALGFYDKGFTVCNRLFNKLTTGGFSISFRIFAIIQDEPERFRRAYRKVILSSTVVGYPAFAGLVATAHPLFLIAFGEKWLPSVFPFQVLCFAFMLKLTNTYAGSAAQARGWIWSQVWRHALNLIIIALGVFLLSPWGINGAAVAVLASAVILWFLMQHLLMSATHFGWRDILEPQLPAVLCAGGIIATAVGAKLVLVGVWSTAAPLTILAIQCLTGALFYLGFLRFSGFDEVTTLVAETLGQVSPRLARLVRLPA